MGERWQSVESSKGLDQYSYWREERDRLLSEFKDKTGVDLIDAPPNKLLEELVDLKDYSIFKLAGNIRDAVRKMELAITNLQEPPAKIDQLLEDVRAQYNKFNSLFDKRLHDAEGTLPTSGATVEDRDETDDYRIVQQASIRFMEQRKKASLDRLDEEERREQRLREENKGKNNPFWPFN